MVFLANPSHSSAASPNPVASVQALVQPSCSSSAPTTSRRVYSAAIIRFQRQRPTRRLLLVLADSVLRHSARTIAMGFGIAGCEWVSEEGAWKNRRVAKEEATRRRHRRAAPSSAPGRKVECHRRRPRRRAKFAGCRCCRRLVWL